MEKFRRLKVTADPQTNELIEQLVCSVMNQECTYATCQHTIKVTDLYYGDVSGTMVL